jgi:hypothetical protein
MTAPEMDRWFVRTDAYLEAIDLPEEYEPAPSRLWTWLVADVILASMMFMTLILLR